MREDGLVEHEREVGEVGGEVGEEGSGGGRGEVAEAAFGEEEGWGCGEEGGEGWGGRGEGAQVEAVDC